VSTTDTTISGGRELDDLLKTLPVKMEKNIMRAAIRAGAAVMREEVRERVPRKSGALAKSVRITTKAKKGEITASVKAGNRTAFYAQMVEFGTRPHIIKAKAGGALDVSGNPFREVQHPGIRARPFMRPAAEAAFVKSIDAVKAKVRERLTNAGINTPAPVPVDPQE